MTRKWRQLLNFIGTGYKSSLSLQCLKLYHKLNMEDPVIVDENPCCSADLGNKDEDLDLIDSPAECDASEFTELVSRGKLKHPPPALYDL